MVKALGKGLEVGFSLLGIAVLFEIAAAVIPTTQTAGNTLNATGIPLGTLFTSTGVLFTIVAVFLLVGAVKGLQKMGK